MVARPVDGVTDPHLHVHCFVMNVTYDEALRRHGRDPVNHPIAQARALYVRNLVRVIPDVAYSAAALAPAWTQSQPLDMSDCALRSVSPVHMQYLRNMGVTATLTFSVIVQGRLWGMVSCHHRKERLVGHAAQTLALDVVRAFEQSLVQDIARERDAAAVLAATARQRWAQKLAGVEVFPSAANFLLIRIAASDEIHTKLLEQKILVKNVGKMHKLLHNCLRITVSNEQENAAFLAAFEIALKAVQSNAIAVA